MLNPITAVTAENPYAFYADLVKRKPVYFDDALSIWIASGAEIVEAVLTSKACRVRPPCEPVPKALLNTMAGRIFQYLVRMNDGELHCPLKKAVAESLDAIDIDVIAGEAEKWTEILFDELYRPESFGWINDLAFRSPIYALAGLLGIGPTDLGETEKMMGHFVRCIAPGGTAKQIEKGKAAAANLYQIFEEANIDSGGKFCSLFNQKLDKAGIMNREIAIANAIGLLFQTYEATAGLIGNSLVALISRREIIGRIKENPALSANFIDEVNRFDPSIQNTRRFVVEDVTIAGENMKKGDVILAVLAAANRDEKVNPNPESFDIYRENRRSFTFGTGKHACPGQNLAFQIAETVVRKLIFSNVEIDRIPNIRYRPSANTRIPLF
jgi:cytochrome P450